MTPIKARPRKPCRESVGMESRSVLASSTLKTGVLPRLTTWVGPLTGAAGLVGTTTCSRGRSVSDIARTFKVHVATIYRLAETP